MKCFLSYPISVSSLWMLALLVFSLMGCCPKDPICEGDVAGLPGSFWRPNAEAVICPCDEPWEEESAAAFEVLQQSNTQITDLLDIALLMNPSTQLTWANARAAAFGVGIAKSDLYPSIVLNDQFNYDDTEFDGGTPFVLPEPPAEQAGTIQSCGQGLNHSLRHSISRAVGSPNSSRANSSLVVGNLAQGIGTSRTLLHDLSISYLLLDFGGRQANIEAAKQALYNSNWTNNRQIQQVIIAVLQNYYFYTGISSLLKARYSDLENAIKNYESAKAQFEVGVRSKLDVLQAETNLINIELSIVQLKGQKKEAYGSLANAMGLAANAAFNVPEMSHISALDVITDKVDQLIEEAITKRPDLAAAYALHAEKKAQVAVTRSQGLPTLNAFVNAQEFNDTLNPSLNTHSLSGVVAINVPLFSGFLYYNQEKQAKEFVRAASATVRSVQNDISLDVVTSYYRFKTAVESLRYSEEYVKFSEETYEAASLGYSVGTSSILDLLAAQSALSNARAQLIQAQTQWAVSLSNISFAMGTTGTAEEIKPWQIKAVKQPSK